MKNHRKLARYFIKVIATSMKLNVEVHGIENIPKDTACIFMANHTSLIDILVMIIGTPYHFNFIAKKELLWVPFIGLDMVMGGDFLIDRRNPRKARKCLMKVEKRLKRGWNMLIFPEGTRSLDGELLPFKRGAFKIAFDSHATVIPCYINGSKNIVQKKSLKASPGTVKIFFGEPIETKLLPNTKDNMIHVSNQTFDKINYLKESNN